MTRVLICDDLEDIRMLFGAVVSMADGMEIAGEASSGDEAIALAQQLQPDIVLLDVAMPGMDGLTALPEIRRVAPHAKVIVVTAYSHRDYFDRAMELGATRFIEKGAMPVRIVETIREVSCAC